MIKNQHIYHNKYSIREGRHECRRFAVAQGCSISETKDFCYFSSLKSKA